MANWQKRARFGLALGGLAMVAVVLLTIRERQPAPAPLTAPRTDPAAVMESTGAVVIRAKGDQQEFRLEAERQLTYEDGTSRLEDVTVTVLGRGGRDFVLKADQARVTGEQNRVELEGHLVLEASDGLTAEAEHGIYDDRNGRLVIHGPLSFRRGRYAGSGVGGRYDRDRDVLTLVREAHILADRTGASEALDIAAGSATLARAENRFRFEGGVTMASGPQVAEAERAVMYLREPDQLVERVELRAASRVTGGAGDMLRAMAADDIDLEYGEDGRSVRRAQLSGEGRIEIGGPGEPGRRIAGERIDIALDPGGAALTELSARRDVSVEMPAASGAPGRTIEAASLDGTPGPRGTLAQVRFEGDVVYRESGAGSGGAPAAGRTVTARRLTVAVTPAFGDITQADFAGSVRLRAGEVSGRAGRARYDVAGGAIELLPADSAAAERPQVVDTRGTIEADRLEIVLGADRADRMTAERNVRSVLKDEPSADGSVEADGARLPGMLEAGEPVYVTAGAMTYDAAQALATYRGGARLWQGERAVQGETIVIDERTGNLSASGRARSRLVLDRVDPKTQATERVDTVATADEMIYEDALRRATYTTDAHASGPQGDVTAARIELYLGEGADTLDRAEAYETVRLQLEKRLATGERLTYFGADGRYVMGGAPVWIVEDLVTECRATTGKTLTFFRSTDTIIVDGNEEHRTQTKTGATCPEPPSP